MTAQFTNPPALLIDGLAIPVRIDPVHEYTLSTKEVALGYDVGESNIREMKRQHADELDEGKHFIVECSNDPNVRIPDARDSQRVTTNLKPGGGSVTRWTKRGIVRLGFFIRSQRAKRFRDLAEDLVIRHLEGEAAPHHLPPVPELIARKIDAFRVAGPGDVETLRALVALHAEITDPPASEPVRGRRRVSSDCAARAVFARAEEAESHSPLAAFLARCFAEFGGRPVTLGEMLRLGAPVSATCAHPSKSLGRALRPFVGRRCRVPGGGVLTVTRHRTRHARCYVFAASGPRPH